MKNLQKGDNQKRASSTSHQVKYQDTTSGPRRHSSETAGKAAEALDSCPKFTFALFSHLE